jgi:hypothetical protein
MQPYVIRLLTLAIYTTAMVVPMITPDEGEASSRHVRKHHARQSSSGNPRVVRVERAASPSYRLGGTACPGSVRSFDCKIWPPPIHDDPDRRGGDGGP